jgi:phosphatidylglycerophosphate synthase
VSAPLTRHAANAVTVLRMALTPAFVWGVVWAQGGGSGWPAAAVFAVAALSDVLDGRVARRLGAESAGGRVLDHAADIVFILAALGLYTGLGLAPWWVPASVAAAFAVYVLDSLRRSGAQPALIGSRIGHIGGVCNYALIGVLVGNDTVGLGWLPPWGTRILFALVPIYSAASIATRVLSGRRRQRSRGVPPAP